MVGISEIEAFNATLRKTTDDLVAVVVGGTNGIGKAFLQQLAAETSNPKIYIVGRRESTLEQIKAELTSLNPSGTYTTIVSGDLTLLSSVDAASKQILSQESKIDILFESQGFLTLNARDETTEGLDKITSIRFYSRMRFVMNLLPLLNAAPSPRVVSVLAGGLEGRIIPDDIALKSPKNYGPKAAGDLAASFNTLFMERLQTQNRKISFVHMFPGFVRTELFRSDHFGFFAKFILGGVLIPLLGPIFGITPQESGKRSLYAATHPKFSSSVSTVSDKAVGSDGTVGTGVYTLNGKDDAVHNDAVLKPLREQGLDEKVWEHTFDEFKRISGA